MLEPFSFDVATMEWLSQHRWPPLTVLGLLVMYARVTGVDLLIALIAGWVFLGWKRVLQALPVAYVAVRAAEVLTHLLKPLWKRPRPPASETLVDLGRYAFPSSHAMMTAALVVAVLLWLPWRSRNEFWWAATIGGIFLFVVGALMVYLGGHWLSDVLVDWALGAAIGQITVVVARCAIRLATRLWNGLPRGGRAEPRATEASN